MGHTRITNEHRGRTVLGSGVSPTTGRNLNGRTGIVQGMERHHGEDVVFVKWNGDNEVDQVRQQNVSGTGPPPEYQSNRRRR